MKPGEGKYKQNKVISTSWRLYAWITKRFKDEDDNDKIDDAWWNSSARMIIVCLTSLLVILRRLRVAGIEIPSLHYVLMHGVLLWNSDRLLASYIFAT
jgi:hypothetical protein